MSKAHREYFNQIAPEWNDKVTYLPLLKEYIVRFGVLAGDRVLDIGAGTGRLTEQLIDLVGQRGLVIGADIAENMLCYAKA
ncbi:methyltransferase domain-containing protein, partial [bacterium]|nr:methyltransferase domain-containing protein [bacterium]